ncbi:hypothetical protein B0H14DRAFT_3864527 [Mycena olivaceomarginata]|nr:hypothetical protein B0H14DRAFT_3864527 [Mycena olivaceomarginata]
MRRDEKPRVRRLGREALGGEDGRCAGLVYCGSLATGGGLHLRVPIPPCPFTPMVPAARLSRYVTARGRLASNYRQASTRTASNPFSQCSLSRSSINPRWTPTSGRRMRDGRCPKAATRQALQAAGSRRRTLRLALTTVARRARRTYGHHPDPDPAFASTRSYPSRGVCAQGKNAFVFAVGVED